MKKIAIALAVALLLGYAPSSEAAYQSIYGTDYNPVESNEPDREQVVSPQEMEMVAPRPPQGGYAGISMSARETSNDQESDLREALRRDIVRVDAVGYANAGDRAGAMDDAQRNAVERVVAVLTSQQVVNSGEYSAICDKYADYIVGFNIVGINDVDGMLEMNAKVTVNSKGLREAVQSVYSVVENEVADAVAYENSVAVLFRFSGSRDKEKASSIVSSKYGEAFDYLKIGMVADDDLAGRIEGYGALSYEDYCTLMKQYAMSSGSKAGFAIIGEIEVGSIVADDSGVTNRATIKAAIYDLADDRHIGNMTEEFFARGANGEEAEELSLQELSEESSRILAQEVSKYLEHKASKQK